MKNSIKKKLIILNYLFLIISFFFLTYIIYRSEFLFNGEFRSSYIFYYIFFSIILFFSLIGILFRKYDLLLFIIFSFLINIYFLELILGFKINIYLEKKLVKINYDTRDYLDFYKSHISNGKASWNTPGSSFSNSTLDKFPLAAGKSNIYTFLCNESGEWSTYTSDRFGFRNDDNLWEKSVDFIALGDSYTFGYCVDEGKNIIEEFNEYSKKKIINLAVGSSGPLHQLAILKEYISFIKKPKTVLWFYQESNDIINLENEWNNKILKKYLNDDFNQNLAANQININKITDKYLKEQYVKNSYSLKKFLKLETIKWKIYSYFNSNHKEFDIRNTEKKTNQARLEKFEIVLSNAKSFLNKKNINLVFLYNPTWLRYSDSKFNNDEFRLKKSIIKIVNELDIEILDIDKSVFSEHRDVLSLYHFRKQSHPTSEAYSLIADFLSKKLN